MLIFWKTFRGRIAKVNPLLLGDADAQTCVNADLRHGDLRAWNGPAFVANLAKVGAIKTIYKFGDAITNEALYWFHWTVEVDVARGQIADDTSERTYFTGDGDPKQTNNVLALTGGTEYPIASRRLGLPAPSTELIATAQGTGSGAPETRVYLVTYVNDWGEESKPSPATSSGTSTVSVLPGQTVLLTNLPAAPSGSYNVTHLRFYRSTGAVAEYFYVGQTTIGQTQFSDTVLASQLIEPIPSLYWTQPPSDMEGLVGIHNGMMAGFRDKEWILLEPYRPFAAPDEYRLQLAYPIVGHAHAGGETVAVLTTTYPYLITGTDPLSMSEHMVKDFPQGCMSKRSIVSAPGGVIYASPDGLCQIGPGMPPEVLTDGILSQEQWKAYKPESIHAYLHDGRYVAFYDTGSIQGGFIYDPKVGFIDLDFYATAGFADPRSDALYLAINPGAGNQVWKWAAGAAKTYTWRGKKHRVPAPSYFGLVQVLADAYPVTVKVFADDSTTAYKTLTVSSSKPVRFYPKRARDWEVEVSGSVKSNSVFLAQSMDDLKNA